MAIDDDNGAGTPAGPDDRPAAYLYVTDREPDPQMIMALADKDARIAELEGALRHAMKFEDALREIAYGNWSNVQPDSQAASDLSQVVSEMQRIALQAVAQKQVATTD